MKLQGLYTALATPFRGDEVDYAGLRHNLQQQIKAQVAGLVPVGTTGEAPTLSPEEFENVITVTVAEAKGKALVLAGTGSNSTAHTIANTRKAKELGADAALIVTPYYNKPMPTGIVAHFAALSRAVDLPLVVYNIPGRSGTNIAVETMLKLSELPNVIAVKEASGNLGQIGDCIDQIQQRRPDFAVLSGDDALTLPIMALGGLGVVSVASNIVPEQLGRMVAAALAGDFATARRLHFALLPLFKALFVESSPIPLKAALALLGWPGGECRLPLCRATESTRSLLRQVLQDLKLLTE